MHSKTENQATPKHEQSPSVSSSNWGSAHGNFQSYYQTGWICPKCGAVMSPTTSCCINCHGFDYSPGIVWRHPFISGLSTTTEINSCGTVATTADTLEYTGNLDMDATLKELSRSL